MPVRVLDCTGSGTWSGVISGIDWAAAHHQAGQPAVANLSLGGAANTSVDLAVQRLINDGVTVAVAAGNDGQPAANYSPARVAAAITVGATDRSDTRAAWSNYGGPVDIFAPGVEITSAWLNGQTKIISGTSMATPHVAGAAALVLSRDTASRTLSPAQVTSALTTAATPDVVVDPAGSGEPAALHGSPATTP